MTFDWFGLMPYFAGSPPALVLGIQLYKSIMTVVDARLWFVGVLIAAAGMVGMIGVEMGTYKMLARAFAEREKWPAFFALIGALSVTGMIIFSVYTGADTRALLSSTMIMLLGYGAVMNREYMDTRHLRTAEQADTTLESKRLDVEMMKQRAAAERARARGARVAKVAAENPKVSESFGSTDWRSVPVADREKMRGMTVKEIMTTYGRSERTAQNWKKNAEATK